MSDQRKEQKVDRWLLEKILHYRWPLGWPGLPSEAEHLYPEECKLAEAISKEYIRRDIVSGWKDSIKEGKA